MATQVTQKDPGEVYYRAIKLGKVKPSELNDDALKAALDYQAKLHGVNVPQATAKPAAPEMPTRLPDVTGQEGLTPIMPTPGAGPGLVENLASAASSAIAGQRARNVESMASRVEQMGGDPNLVRQPDYSRMPKAANLFVSGLAESPLFGLAVPDAEKKAVRKAAGLELPTDIGEILFREDTSPEEKAEALKRAEAIMSQTAGEKVAHGAGSLIGYLTALGAAGQVAGGAGALETALKFGLVGGAGAAAQGASGEDIAKQALISGGLAGAGGVLGGAVGKAVARKVPGALGRIASRGLSTGTFLGTMGGGRAALSGASAEDVLKAFVKEGGIGVGLGMGIGALEWYVPDLIATYRANRDLAPYRKTLGVGKNATAEQIDSAFKSLAKKLHPDVNPSPNAHEQFIELNKAHDILKHWQMIDKVLYDAGAAPPTPAPPVFDPSRPVPAVRQPGATFASPPRVGPIAPRPHEAPTPIGKGPRQLLEGEKPGQYAIAKRPKALPADAGETGKPFVAGVRLVPAYAKGSKKATRGYMEQPLHKVERVEREGSGPRPLIERVAESAKKRETPAPVAPVKAPEPVKSAEKPAEIMPRIMPAAPKVEAPKPATAKEVAKPAEIIQKPYEGQPAAKIETQQEGPLWTSRAVEKLHKEYGMTKAEAHRQLVAIRDKAAKVKVQQDSGVVTPAYKYNEADVKAIGEEWKAKQTPKPETVAKATEKPAEPSAAKDVPTIKPDGQDATELAGAAKPSAVDGVGTKSEPWQMTRSEYLESVWQEHLKKYPGDETSDNRDIVRKSSLKVSAGKHEAAVTKAVLEGKDVPAKVLDEYPTLKEPLARIKAKKAEAPKTDARKTEKPAAVPDAKAKMQAAMIRKGADSLQKQIDERRRPMTQNVTPKRAREHAGRVAEGDKLERLQKRMRMVADAIDAGTLPRSLAGIRTRSHIEELISQANRATPHDKPITLETVRNATFPTPRVHKSYLKELLDATKGLPNTARAREKVQFLSEQGNQWLSGSFYDKDLELLEELLKRAEARKDTPFAKSGYPGYIKNALAPYKRLLAMGIKDDTELRMALEDLLNLGKAELSPEQKKQREMEALERELIGKQIPGYFPTPKAVVEQMLEKAEIEPGMSVLEPSAGKGNIADLIRDEAPEAKLSTIEISGTLRPVLEAKGHKVIGDDFLQHKGAYDRIVMNPPFEQGQDMEHVMHAYGLLKPGGRLVAIMSEGSFFRSDKKATAFREWLEDVVGESEKLPDKSFYSSERPTGVSTRLVVIDKAEEVKAPAAVAESKPTKPEYTAESPEVLEGIKALAENRAYIKNNQYHVGEISTGGATKSGPIAPWNKALKSVYPTWDDAYKAVQEYKKEQEPAKTEVAAASAEKAETRELIPREVTFSEEIEEQKPGTYATKYKQLVTRAKAGDDELLIVRAKRSSKEYQIIDAVRLNPGTSASKIEHNIVDNHLSLDEAKERAIELLSLADGRTEGGRLKFKPEADVTSKDTIQLRHYTPAKAKQGIFSWMTPKAWAGTSRVVRGTMFGKDMITEGTALIPVTPQELERLDAAEKASYGPGISRYQKLPEIAGKTYEAGVKAATHELTKVVGVHRADPMAVYVEHPTGLVGMQAKFWEHAKAHGWTLKITPASSIDPVYAVDDKGEPQALYMPLRSTSDVVPPRESVFKRTGGGILGFAQGVSTPGLFRDIHLVTGHERSLYGADMAILPAKLRNEMHEIDRAAAVVNQKIRLLLAKHRTEIPGELKGDALKEYDALIEQRDKIDERRRGLGPQVAEALDKHGRLGKRIVDQVDKEIEQAEKQLNPEPEQAPPAEQKPAVGREWTSPLKGKKFFIPDNPTPDDALSALLSRQPTTYESTLGLQRDIFGEAIVRPWRTASKQYEVFLKEWEEVLHKIFKPFAGNEQALDRITLMLEGEMELKGPEGEAVKALRKLFYGQGPGEALFKQFEIEADRFRPDYSPRRQQFQEGSVPLGVVDHIRFFAELERKGSLMPRQTNALDIAISYLRAGAKKKFFDPVVKQLEAVVAEMHPDRKRFYEDFQDAILGRPILEERMTNQLLKEIINPVLQLFGKELHGRPADTYSKFVADLSYQSTIGINPASALKNLTQQFLALFYVSKNPVEAAALWVKAKRALFTETGKDLLQYNWVGQHRQYLEGLDLQFRFMEKVMGPMRKIGYAMFERADRDNVNTAYLMGVLKKLGDGKSLEEAVEFGNKVAMDTQFLYGLDSPRAFKGPLGRLIGMLSSWPINFMRLMYQTASKQSRLQVAEMALTMTGLSYLLAKLTGLSFKGISPWEQVKNWLPVSMLRGEKSVVLDPVAKAIKYLSRLVERDDEILLREARDELLASLRKALVPWSNAGAKMYRFIKTAFNDWKVYDDKGRLSHEETPWEAVRGLFGSTVESEKRRENIRADSAMQRKIEDLRAKAIDAYIKDDMATFERLLDELRDKHSSTIKPADIIAEIRRRGMTAEERSKMRLPAGQR